MLATRYRLLDVIGRIPLGSLLDDNSTRTAVLLATDLLGDRFYGRFCWLFQCTKQKRVFFFVFKTKYSKEREIWSVFQEETDDALGWNRRANEGMLADEMNNVFEAVLRMLTLCMRFMTLQVRRFAGILGEWGKNEPLAWRGSGHLCS